MCVGEWVDRWVGGGGGGSMGEGVLSLGLGHLAGPVICKSHEL